MNKAALKKFAIEARIELRNKIKMKALRYGISEDEIKSESIKSSDVIYIDGKSLTKEEIEQRKKLINRIETTSFNQVIEEVAYTWFNRFIAIRYMEVHNYLPTKIRALSSINEGNVDPDIMTEALNINLDIDKEYVYELKLSNENASRNELFKYLIIKQCNALNDILPEMFEVIDDYTELLFPDGLLYEGSFLRVMTDINTIEEDTWDNIEVVGWLYQYYISERKAEVFAGLKKNKKIQKEDIAPATQLFTPDWIVRYMVENSLGRLWQEGHPNEKLKSNWKYYIEESEQEDKVKKQLEEIKKESEKLSIEDIKILDPSMGSGHILVYAFDVLYDIYIEQGYMETEIPKLIIEKNLYGLDIDKRAFQLAYFAIMMKGRSKTRRFFRQQVTPNLCAIYESNNLPGEALEYLINPVETEIEKIIDKEETKYLVDVFKDATEYGSIIDVESINFENIEKRIEELRNNVTNIFEMQHRNIILEIIPDLIKQARIMSTKYDVVCTNPPYMGAKGMNKKLSDYVKEKFPDTKSDLFAVFMELDTHLLKENGYSSMINQHSWMFLSSFEKYRTRLINTRIISSMLHLGPRTFEDLSGEVVQSTAYVLRKNNISDYRGKYIRLVDYKYSDLKRKKTLEAISNPDCVYSYTANLSTFNKIPGSPIAYWASEVIVEIFSGQVLGSIAIPAQGMATADNKKYVRKWYEVDIRNLSFDSINSSDALKSRCKWFPYINGGGYRKWFGFEEDVVNWKNDGIEIKEHIINRYSYLNGNYSFVIKNESKYFREGVTWGAISSSGFSVRRFTHGKLFSNAGMAIFSTESLLDYLTALLNSKIVHELLKILSPTLNINQGDIKKIPVRIDKEAIVTKLSKECIRIAKEDWNYNEITCNFLINPLIENSINDTIRLAYNQWKEKTKKASEQIMSNEEELNRIFIDIYGLQSELTPEVEDKDITIRLADQERDIKSFISYAVGCMFGRYSLDEEGLIYAGGTFDIDRYQKFKADKDNVLPIVLDAYCEDDIVDRFVEFISITFGSETLNENLDFIADTLGKKTNEMSKDTIRRYFIKDFFKDHVKTYKKRPIYWLFTSGKQKAFNALIYMHRYDNTTLARIRTDYLHPHQTRLDAKRESLVETINLEDVVKLKKKVEKELKMIDKQIVELKEYDEVLHHMADRRIDIDLDDGVVVNYEKFKGLVAKI